MPLLAALVPLLLAAHPLAAPSPGGDEEIVREFRKYFRELEDAGSRVEAVLALEGTESGAVVDALVPVLGDDDPEVVDAAVRVLGGFETEPPVATLLEALQSSSREPERLGLLRAVRLGAYPGAGEVLAELLGDRSWPVRRRAVQAVAALGGPDAAERIEPLCGDREPGVRCAALDALAELGSEAVVPHAIADLEHEVWQVRASAIAALGRVRRVESIPPLIASMEREDGRLVADAGASLELLTGRSFGERTEQWRQFWDSVGDRYVLPTDEEMERLRARRAETAAQYRPVQAAATFHGIDTPSRAIVFVIDVSGSMENLVIDEERFSAGDYPSMQRIDIVKTELERTIARLEKNTRFNIVTFATEVRPWKKDLVPANVLNKKSASNFARRLEAIGGHSREHLAAAGLVGAANLEGGKTNTFGALMAALAYDPGEDPRKDDYAVELDTIFFLSDGRPSHGRFVDPVDILREVREANELRRVVIHTIAIGQFKKDFMRRLATENGGVFVDLGS